MATLQEALRLAFEHHRNGRAGEAGILCDRILQAVPRNAAALRLRGALLAGSGQPEEALAHFAKALRIEPADAAGRCGHAAALDGLGRAGEAERGYRRAAALDPAHAPAWFGLGGALRRCGDPDRALAAFARAVASDPALTAARAAHDALRADIQLIDARLAEAHDRLSGGGKDAPAGFRAIVRDAPGHAKARFSLGFALAAAGRFSEADRAYRVAIALGPQTPLPYLLLADQLQQRAQLFSPAAALFGRAAVLAPDDATAQAGLGDALFNAGRLADALPAMRRVVALTPGDAEAHDTLLFSMLALPATSNGSLAAEVERFRQRHGHALPVAPHANDRDPERILRVGYVSGAIREDHNILYFLEPLLTGHDRRRVEVHVYADTDYADPAQARMGRLTEHRHSLLGLDDAQAARRIRDDGVDILVSLLGRGSMLPRTGVFRHRPAPVQVAFHHVMTSADEAMDYWLTDPVAHPPGSTEPFVERLVRLPRYCQYRPPADAPETVAPPLRRNGVPTFGCFTSRWKISDPTIDAWGRILNAVPGSRLLLKGQGLAEPSIQAFYRRRLAEVGVTPERLLFRPFTPGRDNHLAVYNEVDVALDTHPYAYGNTAFEALWMGVPVVTLAGDRFASRMAASILDAAGLEGWITGTPDAFVARTVALARDGAALDSWRRTARAHLSASRICQAPAYARHVERAYRWMWRRWCRGLPAKETVPQ
ncbi:tetratricopeptide repeat protein [Azospirillum doebereinerae]|uniref:protein O-GlcNAc transferase n=2 Tax=Azospirillum doebereinerae TaxID=92933 RepID=A0A3S0V1U0_9PROT|nr:glycosyltransferase family 41 protein [Azospirillum doebereinerae]RUQ72155.1 glycosyltransferase family 41 protein [Azospirillum doebereinerae]